MFTYNDRDLHRMPTPARSHLPIKQFIIESGLLDEEQGRENEADVALLRLPAPALRGTFAKAYELLSRLVAKIGWDELLRCRSQVFVMEEEYRAQKATREGISTPNTPAIQTGDRMTRNGGPFESDDNASTTAIAESTVEEVGQVNNMADKAGTTANGNDLHTTNEATVTSGDELTNKIDKIGLSESEDSTSQSIPTIKVSTESEREQERIDLKGFIKAQNVKEGGRSTEGDAVETVHEAQKILDAEAEVPSVIVDAPPLEKPAIAQSQGVNHTRADSLTHGSESVSAVVPTVLNGTNGTDSAQEHHEQNDTTVAVMNSNFSFSNKRLCERWLDNLFMVLYEDLRVYTIWRAEVNHYKQQSIPYRKTSTEWEILGELALRLHHKEEAKDAFQRCIDGKFSAKAYLKLLEIYTEQKDVEKSLWTALRLTAYHHRWYMENTFPGSVAHALFKLINEVGLAKVNFTLVSMSPSEPILKIMKNYFAYCHTFRVPGYDS